MVHLPGPTVLFKLVLRLAEGSSRSKFATSERKSGRTCTQIDSRRVDRDGWVPDKSGSGTLVPI